MDRYHILLHPSSEPYETREERTHRLFEEALAKDISQQVCSLCGAVGGCRHTTGTIHGYPANQAIRQRLMNTFAMELDPLVTQAIDSL